MMQPTLEETSEFLLNLFLDANADLATKVLLDTERTGYSNLYEFLKKNSFHGSHVDDLFFILRSQTAYPVLYLFDEHNELFKGKSNVLMNDFKKWTGRTGGVSFFFFVYLLVLT
jgi:hypothetical protein